MSKLKQVIIVPGDVKMSPGKLAAQVAHASVGGIVIASRMHIINEWYKQGMMKVVLKIGTTKELLALHDKVAGEFALINYLVSDAGHTELEPGTVTAFSIGPGNADEIDKLTSELKLY